ncbi:MAG: (2Fe-2S) ferredoxin domain-containing protein, partial [Calditerrivibrio sp.]|nr:(2Fe-2S) ferredoxin domain-containing protein [Calditerrivibrio sp.]MCA1933424.1 (2Fe-2S) ferredoxin domain-containing protein [Calditerrivibrio sp.]MCA1981118.1 (2Fe-2S) ferredoxin domain-containing protein [Calditerrivibrio sp.]
MNYEDLLEEIKGKYPDKKDKILVCVAAGCAAMGSEKLLEELKNRFKDFEVKGVGCIGLCSNGPLIKIEPEGIILGEKDIDNIDLLEKEIVRLKSSQISISGNSFFDKQYKIALRNCGYIDPEH